MKTFQEWLKEGGAIIVGTVPKSRLQKLGFNIAGSAGVAGVSMEGWPIGSAGDRAEHRKKKKKKS
jgi:hypothetical protein